MNQTAKIVIFFLYFCSEKIRLFEFGQPRPISYELVQKQIFVHVGITEIGILLEWETDWQGAYEEARNKRIRK